MTRNFAEHLHRLPNPWHGDVPAWALEIREMLIVIILQQEKIMPALDDLKAADAAVVEVINKLAAEVKRLDDKITATPAGTPDAELTPVTTDLTNAVAAGNAALTASQTAVP